LLKLAPVPALLSRVRAELSASFVAGRPTRVSRAPGRLDVMGGIADYTGSLVCEAPLDRAAAVAIQARDDRQVQVFSFNLFDEQKPFTLIVPLDTLANTPIDKLRAEFAQPGRQWGGYLAGCLAILHDEKRLDLNDPALRGVNIALLSDVPLGAGVSSSAAIEVATMMGLLSHYGLDGSPPRPTPQGLSPLDPMKIAAMCQRVENQIVGAPCGIMDQAASCAAAPGALMRMKCQPHELLDPLFLPADVRAIGINSNVKHSVGGGMYGRTRCAAFMGHKIILEKMKQIGRNAGRELISDPTGGYLANLDLDDYKRLFRPYLPEQIKGGQFLLQYGGTIDKATHVEPDTGYHVQSATDHHVFEASRVRNFADFIERAAALPVGDPQRKLLLDKAGHLMYASHISYTKDALLGADECDLLVDLARQRESAGIYGAKITGGGSGGTVAILCDIGETVDAAVTEIMSEYEKKTGLKPEAFLSNSPGAWAVGTAVV
jgi:L-arabinokinase